MDLPHQRFEVVLTGVSHSPGVVWVDAAVDARGIYSMHLINSLLHRPPLQTLPRLHMSMLYAQLQAESSAAVAGEMWHRLLGSGDASGGNVATSDKCSTLDGQKGGSSTEPLRPLPRAGFTCAEVQLWQTDLSPGQDSTLSTWKHVKTFQLSPAQHN
eukprot:jgi/Ulvmu1/6154/UM028_0010.1